MSAPRFDDISPDDYTPEQKAAVDFFRETRGREPDGPFKVLLRSPEVLKRAQYLGAFLRYDCTLSGPHSEFAILCVARIWSNDYEWHVHATIALEKGVTPEIVDAIRHGRRPDGMTDAQVAIHDFTNELLKERRVSDATYARAQSLFGDRGVIDLVGLNGYYSLLAMAMNAVQMRNPDGAEELPKLA
jgi:4-carboxymuconolactone decarboxylase